MRVNGGADLQSLEMGNATVGFTGTSTAVTATSLTSTGFTASAWINYLVFTGAVYGVITANTTTALTVDRWYTPSTPGGSAASTPATGTFVIAGIAPAIFMALTANATTPAATDTTLTSEITTSGGGLYRKLGTYAHTTGASSYTLTATFTANGTDSLPVTVAKAGMFNSAVAATGYMQFEDLLSATCAFNVSGDSAVITLTVNI